MGRLRHLRRQPRAQLEDVLPFVFERPAEHAAGRSAPLAALDDGPALLGGHRPDPGQHDRAGAGEAGPWIVGVVLDLLDRSIQALDRPDDRVEIGALRARDMREDLRWRPALALRPGAQP